MRKIFALLFVVSLLSCVLASCLELPFGLGGDADTEESLGDDQDTQDENDGTDGADTENSVESDGNTESETESETELARQAVLIKVAHLSSTERLKKILSLRTKDSEWRLST